jgi:hypothetical protein
MTAGVDAESKLAAAEIVLGVLAGSVSTGLVTYFSPAEVLDLRPAERLRISGRIGAFLFFSLCNVGPFFALDDMGGWYYAGFFPGALLGFLWVRSRRAIGAQGRRAMPGRGTS